MNFQEGRFGVILAGQYMGLLNLVDAGLQAGNGLTDVAAKVFILFLGQIQQDIQILTQGEDGVPVSQDSVYPGLFTLDIAKFRRVLPDFRIGELTF